MQPYSKINQEIINKTTPKHFHNFNKMFFNYLPTKIMKYETKSTFFELVLVHFIKNHFVILVSQSIFKKIGEV